METTKNNPQPQQPECPTGSLEPHFCFGCGKDNPIGLHLEFTVEGDTYKTVFTPGENHQGYPGVMHGGIASTLVDEVMGRFLWQKGVSAPTAELNVRFKAPVPIGLPITITSRVISHKGRLFKTHSQLILADGTVAIEAEGKFLVAKQHAEFVIA
ncbi:MAG: PaaI family thioesterase [Carboxydocellales bacterium]